MLFFLQQELLHAVIINKILYLVDDDKSNKIKCMGSDPMRDSIPALRDWFRILFFSTRDWLQAI